MSTTFKTGDKVRCTIGTHNSSLKQGEIYTVSHMAKGYVHLVEAACGGWGVARFELVPDEEPKSAEKGTYVVAYIDLAGTPQLFKGAPAFNYWVDAEACASQHAEAAPGLSYGVFKLIGSVQMKPKWSDP